MPLLGRQFEEEPLASNGQSGRSSRSCCRSDRPAPQAARHILGRIGLTFVKTEYPARAGIEQVRSRRNGISAPAQRLHTEVELPTAKKARSSFTLHGCNVGSSASMAQPRETQSGCGVFRRADAPSGRRRPFRKCKERTDEATDGAIGGKLDPPA